MSDHERFPQVAHQKWATMSKLLRSLTKNERMTESLVFLSKSLIRSFFRKKRAIRSETRWANSQPCQKGPLAFAIRALVLFSDHLEAIADFTCLPALLLYKNMTNEGLSGKGVGDL